MNRGNSWLISGYKAVESGQFFRISYESPDILTHFLPSGAIREAKRPFIPLKNALLSCLFHIIARAEQKQMLVDNFKSETLEEGIWVEKNAINAGNERDEIGRIKKLSSFK